MNLNNINDDCLENILSFLDLKDKIRIIRVCKRWQIIILNQLKHISNLLISSDFNEFNNFICFNNNNQLNIFKPEIKFYNNYNILMLSLSNKLNLFQFDRLIAKFTYLNSIKFKSKKNLQLISAYALDIIIKRCKLIKIDLSNCRELDDNCIRKIGNCSTLEYLNLTNCRNYGNNSLKQILSQCTNLKELHIGYHKRLTGHFFRHSKCELEYLNLEECSKFNDKGLHLLANKMGYNLVCLITFPISTNERLEFICSKFINLNVLKLTFLNENLNLNILINNLNLNNNLISLSLNRSIKLNDFYLSKLILNFKKIKEFELCPINNQTLIYYSLLDLSRLWTKLTRLRLSNIKLTTNQNRSVFESILNLNFLSYLSLENLQDIDEKDIVYLLNKLIDKKLTFINLEYYQKQPKIKLNLIAIKDSLNKYKNLNYKTSIYQLRLEKQNPHLYLSKIKISK